MMGETISLRVLNLPAQARKVVKQIETSRSPDPIMRRPRADREEGLAARFAQNCTLDQMPIYFKIMRKRTWLFSGSGVLSGRHDGRAAKALGW